MTRSLKFLYYCIEAQKWANILVAFVLSLLQQFLTDVWKLSFTRSAEVLNLWEGVFMILPFSFLLCARQLMGNFYMLVASRVAYCLGIILFLFSTPPILGNSIGHTQRVVFFTGLASSALAISGQQVSLVPFLKEQRYEPANKWKLRLILCLFHVIGSFLIPLIKPWSIRFGILVLSSISSTVLFMVGWPDYEKTQPHGKFPFQTFNFIRRKFPFRMLIFLIPCGIVSSTGHTFFMEQAVHMNHKIGGLECPIQVFVLLSILAKIGFETLTKLLFRSKKIAGVSLIYPFILPIMFCILPCIAAAITEARRLHMVRSHGQLDKPYDDIPMSMFWMSFQFILLAGQESILKVTVDELFKDQTPECIMYVDFISQAGNGMGHILSALLVLIVSNQTKWFQKTLNKSRLDRYYWTLAIVQFIFGVMYFIAASCTYNSDNLEKEQHKGKDTERADK